VAPGAYDALSARLVEQAGFDVVYMTGFGTAASLLGRPDVGLLTASEMLDNARRIAAAVDVPVVADADTGYGAPINVIRTVRDYEDAGVAALQLEDQAFPKRCGHLRDKNLVSTSEMAGKVKAAVDARASAETLIVARTDAVAVEGFEAAVERARLYADAGADVLFVEAPRDRAQMDSIVRVLGGKCPLMANMVEGGDTPISTSEALGQTGFRLVIFPGGIVRALAKTARDYYGSLARHGSNEPFRSRMFDFTALNAVVGTPEMLARGQAYEGKEDAA
jgi:2-methylisocitrate lyase-like PEP mutase family enzyme